MGANAAIETAAELLNALLDMNAERRNCLEDLTPDEIKAFFERVQDARFKRAGFTVSTSHDLQALIAYGKPILATIAFRVFMRLAGEHDFSVIFSREASVLCGWDISIYPHVLMLFHTITSFW